MPMSWLMPAFCVQRSALAEMTAVESALGVIFSTRCVASIVCQVVPSLSLSWYWLVLAMVYTDPVITADAVQLAVPPLESVTVTVTDRVPAEVKAWVAITVAAVGVPDAGTVVGPVPSAQSMVAL